MTGSTEEKPDNAPNWWSGAAAGHSAVFRTGALASAGVWLMVPGITLATPGKGEGLAVAGSLMTVPGAARPYAFRLDRRTSHQQTLFDHRRSRPAAVAADDV